MKWTVCFEQFLKAYETFNDFDYYFFVEDDYVPNINNFDTKLINLYKVLILLIEKLDLLIMVF